MRRLLVAACLVLVASLGLVVSVSADDVPPPDNWPDNPQACVGYSSTSANWTFQEADPDKFRADQAHGEFGPGTEIGRQDDIISIFNQDGNEDCHGGPPES